MDVAVNKVIIKFEGKEIIRFQVDGKEDPTIDLYIDKDRWPSAYWTLDDILGELEALREKMYI